MKLRLRGNSLRLRLTQSELKEVAERGSVADAVAFGPRTKLTYRLEVSADGALRASFTEHEIRVLLPRPALERWLAPAEVGVRAEQPLGGGEMLSILVEKDFQCLAPGEENQSDFFPNPGNRPC
jgi:hypothetical protein